MNNHARLYQSITAPLILFFTTLVVSAGLLLPTVAQAEITIGVDDRVNVQFEKVEPARKDKIHHGLVQVTNVSSADILAPLRLVITGFKNSKYQLHNADGLTADGDPYIDIELAGERLPVGATSAWTELEFSKLKSQKSKKSKKSGKSRKSDKAKKSRKSQKLAWPSHPLPVKFHFAITAGAALATTPPTSLPVALQPGMGLKDVLFRVNLQSNGAMLTAPLFLRNLTTAAPDVEMRDDGIAPDIEADDGIYVLSQSINTDALMADDCLTYVSSIVDNDGFEVVSSEYDLCATSLPITVAESDTSAQNQVQVQDAPAVSDEVIVYRSDGFREADLLEVLKSFGGVVVGTLLPSNLFQVKLPAGLSANELNQLVADLKATPGIADAGPNFIGSYDTADTDFALQHGLQLVGADDLGAVSPRFSWEAGANASGITVTVIDSGIDAAHEDFAPARIAPEISPGYNTDSLGHGTQMAGIIGAETDNSTGIGSLAQQVTIESIKISDGSPTQTQMLAGLTTAAGPSSSGDVVLAAFSIFGPLLPTAGMCSTINTIINGGGVVVGSAGNNDANTGTGVWPARCNDATYDPLLGSNLITAANKPHYIVVGASNCNVGACASDTRKSGAGGSNYGPWLDLSAPGNNVRTTTTGSAYTGSSGTSAASAFTAGAAAVLRGCGVAANQVFNSLNLGATTAVTQLPNRINLYNSLASLNTNPSAVNLSGSMTIDENVNTSGGAVIGSLGTVDATVCDTHSYTILPGVDAASFSLGGSDNDQLVLTAGTLNFEAKSSYSVTVQSNDFFGGTPTSQMFSINVIDLNEAPSISPTVRSIDENTANGTNVGAPIPASDVDAGSSLTYAITGGNTGAAFAIDNSGQISVANSAALDFETTPVFNLTVEVTDNGAPGLSASATVTVNLNDLVETLIPNPVLVFDRVEDGVNFEGTPVRRWFFNVSNSASYALALFEPTSAYGPCGLNTTPSRVWVDFYDAADDSRLMGFCALGEPANLNGIWFGVLDTDPGPGTSFAAPPASGVYIKLLDRATTPTTEIPSNVVSGLPNP